MGKKNWNKENYTKAVELTENMCSYIPKNLTYPQQEILDYSKKLMTGTEYFSEKDGGYLLISPSGSWYQGTSKNSAYWRCIGHFGSTHNKWLRNSLKLHGVENYVILSVGNFDNKNHIETEILGINILTKKFPKRRVNITDGGDGFYIELLKKYQPERYTEFVVSRSLKIAENLRKDIDDLGINGIQRKNIKAINTRSKDIDEFGRNGNQRISFKCAETLRKKIDETGIDGNTKRILKGYESLRSKIDENGIDGVTRKQRKGIQTRSKDIDEFGRNGNQRISFKCAETLRNNIDEFGRNGLQRKMDKATHKRLWYLYLKKSDNNDEISRFVSLETEETFPEYLFKQ